MKLIETKRLILRSWATKDAKAYFEINQDPKVTEFLLGPMTMSQVQDFIKAENAHQKHYGFSLFATELKATHELLGFVGFKYIDFSSNFTPTVEIGWRMGSQYWNQGYAIEGAIAALYYGFKACRLKKIVSFTVPANARSLKLMEKLGLKRVKNGDFSHPKLPQNHPLSKHVLYRLTADEYLYLA